jgi:hypothetical protein
MTEVLLIAMTLFRPATMPPTFTLQTELQGLYDEISQATATDVDLYHDVLYLPDWVFVDPAGQRQTWPQIRQRTVQTLSAVPPDSMIQTIRKLTVAPGGATVEVTMTTVRNITDREGRYGRQGMSHTVADTAVFRDSWVRASDGWKMKSREEIGRPTVSVEKSEWR